MPFSVSCARYFPTNGGGDGRDVTYQRLPECSLCSPGKVNTGSHLNSLPCTCLRAFCLACLLSQCGNWTAWALAKKSGEKSDLWHDGKPRPPAWCCAEKGNDGPCSHPFDPEGFVSTLTCVVASVFGLHFGHVLVHFRYVCCSSHAP
jgi:hypothetical protein